MSDQAYMKETLAIIIRQTVEDEHILNDDMINRYISTIELPDVLPDSDLSKQIDIELDSQGDVALSTSLKIPNLKFRLGDFLLEAIGSGITAAGSLDKPLALVLLGIKFLRNVRQLATVTINKDDAKLLMTIYQLVQEEPILTVDRIDEVDAGTFGVNRIAQSLETLERLGCIVMTMNEVRLNETIIVHRETY